MTDISGAYLLSDQGLGLLSQLFKSAGEGMIIFDGDGKIVAANPRSEEQFGWVEKELIGETAEKLIPVPIRAKHMEYRNHFSEQPAVRSMGAGRDLQALRKDGSSAPEKRRRASKLSMGLRTTCRPNAASRMSMVPPAG